MTAPDVPDHPPHWSPLVGGLREAVPMTITAAHLRRSRLVLADLIIELNLMVADCEDLYADARADDRGQLVRDLANDLSATWVAGMRAAARLRALTVRYQLDADPPSDDDDPFAKAF